MDTSSGKPMELRKGRCWSPISTRARRPLMRFRQRASAEGCISRRPMRVTAWSSGRPTEHRRGPFSSKTSPRVPRRPDPCNVSDGAQTCSGGPNTRRKSGCRRRASRPGSSTRPAAAAAASAARRVPTGARRRETPAVSLDREVYFPFFFPKPRTSNFTRVSICSFVSFLPKGGMRQKRSRCAGAWMYVLRCSIP